MYIRVHVYSCTCIFVYMYIRVHVYSCTCVYMYSLRLPSFVLHSQPLVHCSPQRLANNDNTHNVHQMHHTIVYMYIDKVLFNDILTFSTN